MKYKLPFREGLSSLILAGVLSGCVSSRPKINYLPLEQDSRRVEEAQEKETFLDSAIRVVPSVLGDILLYSITSF